MDEFYKTRMGRQFFEVTMPKIADELERFNECLERLSVLLEPSCKDPQEGTTERPEGKREA